MKKLIVIIAFACNIWQANAQSDTLSIDDFYIDYSVPDISALGMLGIENDEIVRPGNLKEFAAAISNFADSDGSLRPALALEWSLFQTFKKNDPIKWKKRYQPRNLAISMATTEQDSLGLRMGIGFKWVPIDKSDPMGDTNFYNTIATLSSAYYSVANVKKRLKFNDFVLSLLGYTNPMSEDQQNILAILLEVLDNREATLKSYRKKINNGEIIDIEGTLRSVIEEELNTEGILPSLSAEDKENLVSDYKKLISVYTELILDGYSNEYEEYGSYINSRIKKQKEEYKKNNWNAFAVQISGGWVGHSVTKNYKELRGEQLSGFGVVSLPTRNNNSKKHKGQLLIHGKYNLNVSNDSVDFTGFSIGFRHLYGTSDNRLTLEGLIANSETELTEAMITIPVTYIRYTVGAELKLTDGTWLEFAFGGQKFLEGENEENRILSTFGFKHAIRNKRRYDYRF